MKAALASSSTTAPEIAQLAPMSHQVAARSASTGDTAKSTRTGCCRITSRALFARIRSMSLSLPAMRSECQLTSATQSIVTALAGRRFGRCESPVVRILRGIHHRKQLTHRRPGVDVDGHALIDGVLIDGRPVDHARDRDVLLTAGVRSRADSGHQ